MYTHHIWSGVSTGPKHWRNINRIAVAFSPPGGHFYGSYGSGDRIRESIYLSSTALGGN